MFAVGVDVSNGRSMVAVLGTRRSVVMKPFEVQHTVDGFASLTEKLNGLDGEIRIVMEHTGRYYESFAMNMYRAGFFVSAVNPLAIKDYQEGINVRKVKTDKVDAQKIAQFAIDKWEILPQYTPMDTIRYDLKTLHRQFQLSNKTRIALNNNLIALLEQSYPGANRYFDSPVRPDGSQKWVDFVDTFWHVDCIAKVSRSAFVERYRKWCKRHGYNFSEQKAVEIHEDARQKFPLVPKSDTCKLLVKEAVAQLNAISRTVETYRAEMDRLASQLPEYDTVMAMTGVGRSMGPQLMAEIGDLRCFAHQKSLVGFAGTDPIKDDSGDKVSGSKPSSKRGSPYLRKTLFVIMTILLQLQPQDDPVYQFLDKKRSEGKKYYVYMTAGMTKFLRIYYGRVRDCLKEQGLWDSPSFQQVGPV
ncbi:MAG: IS110 family transposase [Clostridia bacterium]|nr:IS110 family transposase [Clostridia bacterium]